MGLGASEADSAAGSGRRTVLRAILACALLASGTAAVRAIAQQRAGHALDLPAARDLAADAAASAREAIPILLFFDRQDCPYCERALTRFVVPMSNEAPWRERALYRQIEIDQPLELVDFDGGVTTHARLAARYGVSLTPTVIVVDGRGGVIGTPIVGLLTADFYVAYLERAIDAGVAKLRATSD